MQKSLKNLLLYLGLAVLGLALLTTGLLSILRAAKTFHRGDLTGTAEQFSIVGREVTPLPVRDSGNFVILQFTDTHLTGTRGKDARTLAKMEMQLLSIDPDLVVITGDMLEGYNNRLVADKRGALCAVADIFERHGRYWAWVPGNSDTEYLGSGADVAAFLGQNYPHCLLANAEDIVGATHFVVPVVDAEGVIVHALVFMDSLARDPETNYMTYDCMKKSQADWLRVQLATLKEQAPMARVSVFFHANTPAFTQAMSEGEPYADKYALPDFPESRTIRGNEIVDRALREAGSVGLVSIGCLHPRGNQCAWLDGTYYHVTRASGYRAARRPGAAVITIHTYDGSPRRLYDFEEIVF